MTLFDENGRLPACCLCESAKPTGRWELCPECKARMVERHNQAVALMTPDYCMGCFAPRRQPPVAGSIYCPRCQRRYEGR
jgi:uncharacterized protein YbaR (Trm112 family)